MVLIITPKLQTAIAIEKPALDETINYLEGTIPEATGIKTYFSAKLMGRQVVGTKQENYKLKIVNKELIIIEKNNTRSAITTKDNESLSKSQSKITEVIKMENLDPKITLTYKINPTEGDDVMKAIYPPHIKIKIKAKPASKWKVYKNNIEQVTSMFNQTGKNHPASHYEAQNCMLYTTNEAEAENIAKALSHLIILCGGKK
ncbi:methyl-accepting chemotaxis sensory transducer [Candidatus Scalindua japonica]|uniref:Methyl-accepting chemotaxis sensory transducer n=2 Tax=Candidatus Scalindua japonica TaxID=1284222 RepID=A0A286U349_9BACT|nr:methyl-accepting chemotaxis sensory transducer [Candidatus Scalindua japonica]